jgi:hypothetical protein
LLYLSGVVNPTVLKMRYIIVGFIVFVIIGLTFTIFKYTVLLGQTLSLKQILDAFFIVFKISAILIGFWGLLAFLGNKRIEKQIR